MIPRRRAVEHRSVPVTPRAFCFGDYRLDPAARELRRDGRLLPLPRRVFDGLAYLIEHRDRAVGHDELIAALWGRVDVANAQVSQLVMQVRRAVGDDSNTQRAVRTVSGFGYRWIVATDEVSVDRRNSASTTAPVEPSIIPEPSKPLGARATRWPAIAALVVAGLFLTAVAIYLVSSRPVPLVSTPHALQKAVAVLPIEVADPEDENAAWVRLGAMDLVAARLRRAGLPVPPSDSVVAAMHASTPLPPAERLGAIQKTLGADALVQGIATRSPNGWKIELSATASDGVRHRVEVERAEVMDTARQAADLLLAALGRSTPDDSGQNEALSERLQRAKAAMLAGELDTARSILTEAPAAMRAEPALRYELVRLDYQAGKLDEAGTLVADLLGDPVASAEPRLRAKVLRIRGWIVMGQGKDWDAAERDFDAAVAALHDTDSPADLGKALAERGVARVFLHRFDEAALDLGQARSQLEIAGDRQGLGEMNNYLGQLEFIRQRVSESVPYFNAAAEISESFGSVDTLRYNLSAALHAHMRLLRWQDALATSERLHALRERIAHPGMRATIDGYRAIVAVATGRLREAETILAENAPAGIAEDLTRMREQARAELAWQQGRYDLALAASARTLAVWPSKSSSDADQAAGVALLHQRASIATGHAEPANIATLEPVGDDSLKVYRLIAAAEWSAYEKNDAEADRGFRDAIAAAETQGVPDTIVLATVAYAHWLLARDRAADASARAGRIAVWADQDFASALLQVEVFHASGQTEAWSRALRRAQQLAGERAIPAALLAAPTR